MLSQADGADGCISFSSAVADVFLTTCSTLDTIIMWHSSFEYAIAAVSRAGVKRLALFHHDPDRTDQQIDEMAAIYCMPGRYGDIEVFFAREGQVIAL